MRYTENTDDEKTMTMIAPLISLLYLVNLSKKLLFCVYVVKLNSARQR